MTLQPTYHSSRTPSVFSAGHGPFIVVFVFVLTTFNLRAIAETHKLRSRGPTLIEAEDYSRKSSAESPRSKESVLCSGRNFLGYFWPNEWFELDVDVPQMLNYTMSLRASSEEGTKLNVLMLDETGNQQLLTTIDVPKTQAFTNYQTVQGCILALPKGTRTLRFFNVSGGVDLDYIRFAAGSKDDIVRYRPDKVRAGEDRPAEDRTEDPSVFKDQNFEVAEVRHLVSPGEASHTHIEIDLRNLRTTGKIEVADVQLAVLNSETGEVFEVQIDSVTVSSRASVTLSGSCYEEFDPSIEHRIGLRFLPARAADPKASETAQDAFPQGDWMILDAIERRPPERKQLPPNPFFPLQGSFRPVEGNR